MNPRSAVKVSHPPRKHKRFAQLQDLSVIYEGHNDVIPLHAPDISPRGMFINTPCELPEGAVLKVKFRLGRSNFVVSVRCEVRYCLPGVGVGVEFIQVSPEAQRAIEKALA